MTISYYAISLIVGLHGTYNMGEVDYQAHGPYMSQSDCEIVANQIQAVQPQEQGSRASSFIHRTACIGTKHTETPAVSLLSVAHAYNYAADNNVDSIVMPVFKNKYKCEVFADEVENQLEMAGLLVDGGKRYVDIINTCLDPSDTPE